MKKEVKLPVETMKKEVDEQTKPKRRHRGGRRERERRELREQYRKEE